MANVSHEFNNVITVISELAGLLKDLALMSQKGREVPPDKILSISDNISRQVARGKHLVSHMNRFSHSTDEPKARADLEGVVENMQVLTDRLFKCRRSRIDFRSTSEEYSLETDPFELRRILFLCLDRFLALSSSEVSINISGSGSERDLELRISGEAAITPENMSEKFEELKEQAAALKGLLYFEQSGKQVLVRLVLPVNHN